MKFIKNNYLLIFLVFVIAFFLRFYQLGDIPAGFLNDEANAGYDAYSILLTGKDQWGTFLPINNFIGFGDFQPPVNRYSMVIPIFLFGLNEFSVRFVSALAGVLSVIALYFLTKKLVDKKAAIFSSLFLAIMPWSVGLNRIAHESNIAILFLIIALFFGVFKKNSKDLFLSAFFIALTMYTYSAYILYAPLVLAAILFINYKREDGFKSLIKLLIFFLIIISPIIFQKNAASVRFSQVGLNTNINSVGLINTLNDKRGQCQKTVNPFICKIVDNKPLLFTNTFIKNYLSHFSTNFLYISGNDTQFSILPKRGLDYLYSFPFLILGLVFLIKNNKHKKINFAFVFLFLLSPVPDSFTSDGNYVRSSIMIPFLALFNGLGFYYLFNILKQKKGIKYLSTILFSLVILFSTAPFFITYTTYFKNNYSIFSQYGYKDLMEKTHALKCSYERIYITRHLNDAKQYIYYLFFNKYDPVKYQGKKDVSYGQEENGWLSIDRIENIYFVQNPPVIDENSELSTKKILIISNPVDFPKEIKPVFVVEDRLGNILFKAVNLSELLKYNKEYKEGLSN